MLILGITGGHDANWCLVRDGVLLGAVEKERFTRRRHDTGEVASPIPETLTRLGLFPGDLVFRNCRTVHQATADRTDRPRRAFSIQYMPADARYNGYEHEFLKPYAPVIGDELTFPCFAVPAAPE